MTPLLDLQLTDYNSGGDALWFALGSRGKETAPRVKCGELQKSSMQLEFFCDLSLLMYLFIVRKRGPFVHATKSQRGGLLEL